MWFFLAIAAVWIGGIAGLSGMVVYAVISGRLPNKWKNAVFRDETPRTFWCLICAWIVLIAGMSYFAIYVASAPGIGLL